MKRYKRMMALLGGLILALMLLPIDVLAAGSIDLGREVQLTISYKDGETPLAGAEFQIYLVAKVDPYGELTKEEKFEEFDVNIRGKNDEEWRALAVTLEEYVLRGTMAPTDAGMTDANGKISFSEAETKLTPGLYLVTGKRHEQKGYSYEASPFMVMLPAMDMKENEWMYEVTADAKFGLEEIPPGPDTDETPNPPVVPSNPQTPGNSKLPQTGQLWWPVPMLLAAGLLFIVIGLIRRRGAMDED